MDCCREGKEISTDTYGDKLIKFITIPATTLLGIIILVVLYLVDKTRCYDLSNLVRNPQLDEFCFDSILMAGTTPDGASINKKLMHKVYPIILICEALSLLILVIIWHWIWSRNLASQVRCILDYCNSLTDYYRKYDKGMRTAVTEATLHREIDNFLEYFAYLMMEKSRKLYVGYILKWVSHIVICVAWFAGHFVMFYPKFVMFEDEFECHVNNANRNIKAHEALCKLPTSTFMRAVWYINVVLLGMHIIIALIHICETCYRRKFSSSFFYRTIPGAMDSRLSDCVELYFNPKYYFLVSRFCDSNSNLCTDVGLSRSLARKYGTVDGLTPGRETIMDKHYPVMQPEQIRKFRMSSEKYFHKKKDKHLETSPRLKSVHYGKRYVQVRPKGVPRLQNISGSVQVSSSSGYSANDRSDDLDRISYMTPRLMSRKLQRITPRGVYTGPLTSTPKFANSEDDLNQMADDFSTQKQRGVYRKYTAKHVPRQAGTHPKFVSRSRDLNPFAYHLDYTIRKNIAASLHTWKP